MTVKSLITAAAMAALPALLLAGPKSTASSALKDFRAVAIDASEHAGELQSLTRDPGINWRTEAYQLQALKADINDMAKQLSELEESGDSAAIPPEAAALLKSMAENTSAAIKFLSAHEGDTWAPAFLEYANHLADESDQLASEARRAFHAATAGAGKHQAPATTGGLP